MRVIIPVGSSPVTVAQVPAALRTADLLRRLPQVRGVTLLAQTPEFFGRWQAQLTRLEGVDFMLTGSHALSEELPQRLGEEPVLVVSPSGIPEASTARSWVSTQDQAARWTYSGVSVAAYYPDPQRLLACLERILEYPPLPSDDSINLPKDWFETLLSPAGLERRPLAPDAWQTLSTDAERRDAERRLFESLRQPTDGFIARWDRFASIALSKRLIRTPITPNQITTAGLFLGLLGAAMLAFGGYVSQLAGALVLCFCCILDGCDGEVARLKLLSTPNGGRYDLISDHIVHAAIFAALWAAMRRLHPDGAWLGLGLTMSTGVLLSMFVVWRLILAREAPATSTRVFEQVASRDFIYLIFMLVLIRRLDWFIWGAAIGSHLFWLSLCAIAARSAESQEA